MTDGFEDLLAGSPPFAYMETEAVRAFAAVCRLARFETGDHIFLEQQNPNTVLVVLEGAVYICSDEAEGHRVIEAVMAPVESFGWLSLVAGYPRVVSAQAGTRATLLLIAKRDVMAVLDRHPSAWRGIAQFLAERLRRTLSVQRSLAGFPMPRRIAFALCQAFRIGVAGTNPLSELDLSQDDLASMAAASRQSVNRQLRAWVDAGLIEVGYGSLRLLKPDQLLRLAQTGRTD